MAGVAEDSNSGTEGCWSAAPKAAEALIIGLCGGHGIDVFDTAFGRTRPSNFFGNYFNLLKPLMRQSLKESFITKVNETLAEIIDWVLHIYIPMRRRETSKARLNAALEPKVTLELYDIVYSLMEEDSSELCLSAFIFSALMYLTLMQELALMDPDVGHPADSEYICPIEIESEQFRCHVRDCHNHINGVRNSYITEVQETLINEQRLLPSGKVARASAVFVWGDNFTGYEHDDVTHKVGSSWTNGEPKVLKDIIVGERREYLREMQAELRRELCCPHLAVGGFNRCSDYPLPSKAMTEAEPTAARCEKLNSRKQRNKTMLKKRAPKELQNLLAEKMAKLAIPEGKEEKIKSLMHQSPKCTDGQTLAKESLPIIRPGYATLTTKQKETVTVSPQKSQKDRISLKLPCVSKPSVSQSSPKKSPKKKVSPMKTFPGKSINKTPLNFPKTPTKYPGNSPHKSPVATTPASSSLASTQLHNKSPSNRIQAGTPPQLVIPATSHDTQAGGYPSTDILGIAGGLISQAKLILDEWERSKLSQQGEGHGSAAVKDSREQSETAMSQQAATDDSHCTGTEPKANKEKKKKDQKKKDQKKNDQTKKGQKKKH